MGRKAKNRNRDIVESYRITPDIRRFMTSLRSCKNFEEVKELLRNNDRYITLTRLQKRYYYKDLYEMASNIHGKNIDGSLYISKSQIYKYCINNLAVSSDILHKVDDSKFVSFSRLKLDKRIHCYLFSLIHPNTLNFDKTGMLFCNKIKQDLEEIPQLEYELANSILLDGLLLAFDEIITNDNNTYRVVEDSDTKAVEIRDRNLNEITNSDYNYSLKLLKLLSPTLLYLLELRNSIYEDGGVDISVQKILSQNFVLCEKYASKQIDPLFDTYNSLTDDMLRMTEKMAEKYQQIKKKSSDKSDNTNTNAGKDNGKYESDSNAKGNSKSKDKKSEEPDIRLFALLNLYHINRYTHIFDMDLMRNFDNATLHFHKLGGFLTSITLNKIFNPDPNKRINALKDDLRFRNSILYPNILEERDYSFIRQIIIAAAGIFKDIYFIAYSNNRIDQEKAYKFFVDFSTDDSIRMLLNDMDIEQYIYTKIDVSSAKKSSNKSNGTMYKQFSDCFNIIYDDLYRTANYGKRLCKEYLESVDSKQITDINLTELADKLYYFLQK